MTLEWGASVTEAGQKRGFYRKSEVFFGHILMTFPREKRAFFMDFKKWRTIQLYKLVLFIFVHFQIYV